VKGITFHLSFQSRVGPVQWLRPYTDDMLKKMGEEEKVRLLCMCGWFFYFCCSELNLFVQFIQRMLWRLFLLLLSSSSSFTLSIYTQVRNLIVVPVSFVSEHIETLEEIDMEYRELALESGVTHWERAPALNTEPGFIQDIADLVVSVS